MRDWKYYDIILSYVEGKMTEAEVASFELRLGEDIQLREEYELLSDAKTASELLAKADIRRRVQSIAAADRAVSVPKPNYWLRAAIGLLLLAFVGAFVFAQSKYSNQALANAARPGDFSNHVRSEQATAQFQIDVQLEAAVESFDKKDYRQAVKLFESIEQIVDFNNQERLQLWLAVSYLGGGELEKFEEKIQSIQQDNRFSQGTKQKAAVLKKQTNSLWRKLVVF